MTPAQARELIAQFIGTPEQQAPYIASVLRPFFEPMYEALYPYRQDERNNTDLLFRRVAWILQRPPSPGEWSAVLGYTVPSEVCQQARTAQAYDNLCQRYITEHTAPIWTTQWTMSPMVPPPAPYFDSNGTFALPTAAPPMPTIEPAQALLPIGDWTCSECEGAFNGDEHLAPMERSSHARSTRVCMDCAAEGSEYTALSSGNYAMPDEVATCSLCDTEVMAHDTQQIDDQTVCDRCVINNSTVVHCTDDGEPHLRENATRHNGDWYYNTDNICYDSDDEEREEDNSNTSVYSYSANVLSVLGRKAYVRSERLDLTAESASKSLVFGVELETCEKGGNSRDDIANAVLETSFRQYGICKSDGTVSGPELVTLPADLESHRKLFKWADWCKALTPVAHGYHAEEESAGMHVHINRSAVSPYTAGKMLVFMNDTPNHQWLEMIAQREVSQNRYCQFKAGKQLTDGQNVNNDRYEALNITRHTIEVRIFRSNLSEQRIYKNLEFCHALVKYCEQESAQTLTAERMQCYITAHRSEYPALYKFIQSRTEDK